MDGVVFISHSRLDAERAKELEHWLQNEIGLPTFLDQNILKTGHAWRNTIKLWLENSFVVIVLVSKQSMSSRNVTFEWAYAMRAGTPIVPLVIEDNLTTNDIHDFIQDIQYNMKFIAPTSDDYDKLKDRLLEFHALANVPDEVQQAIKLARSPIPSNQEHAINLLKEYPDASATRELRVLAKDRNIAKRQVQAALALAEKTDYRDIKAINGLIRGIDESGVVSDRINPCFSALRDINTNEVAQALYDLFDKSEKVKINMILERALTRMDTENLPKIFYDILLNYEDVSKRIPMIKYMHEKRSELTVDVVLHELPKRHKHVGEKFELYQILGHYSDDRIPTVLFDAIDVHSEDTFRASKNIVTFSIDELVKYASKSLLEDVEKRYEKNKNRRPAVFRSYNAVQAKMRARLAELGLSLDSTKREFVMIEI